MLLSGCTTVKPVFSQHCIIRRSFSEIIKTRLFLFASREKNPVSQEENHLMDDKNKIKQEEKRDIAQKRVSSCLLLCACQLIRGIMITFCSTLLNKEPSQAPVYSAGSVAVT